MLRGQERERKAAEATCDVWDAVENGRTMPYPEHNVSANWTWDALASYRLTSPAGVSTLALGVRNLANQRPPRLYNAFLSYADPDYDFVGRYIYGRVEHRF